MERPSTPLADETHDLVTRLGEMTLPLMWTLRQEAVRAFEPYGLRPLKALLLEFVDRGMHHPKELAEVLDSVPPAISAMIAELETQGLLKRSADPEDRRRVILEITEQGHALRQELGKAWHQVILRRVSKLDRDEIQSLIRIYEKLLQS